MDAPNPKLAEQFGRYRINKRLGQGGMGSVYLAQDTHLGRAVALKIPDFEQHEAPEARRRFLEEARTAATLDHPYLCRVYETGEIDGQLYLTMAYIEGQSLAALIGEDGWPQRQVAALVGKLALALQEAHRQKVIHRDLKPANVMIKTTGGRREPVIVDFGLARRDNPQDQRLTRSGQVMGTLAYMAPEQIRGDLNEIGPACDIYALGVILYELLTGRLPFSGSGLAVAGKILTQAPLPPSAHRSDTDPVLEAICLKAMAKAVGDRYASMAELAAALTGLIHSLSTSSASIASVGSTGSPSPASGERPKTPGSDSLVHQFLGQLVENDPSLSPIPTPTPVASRSSLLDCRWPPWPLFVGAAVLGVLLLGGIIYLATDKGRITVAVNDPATLKSGTGPDSTAPAKRITNSIGMRLVLIPSGTFLMGTLDSDKDADEKPQHRVRITLPFYLGVHEVTRGQFRRFVDETGYQTEAEKDGKGGLGYDEQAKKSKQDPKFNWLNPGFEQTDEHPVLNVSWTDTVAFARWLSRKEGRTYRLPTEAEWEYACRAGTTTRYQSGDDPEGLAAVGNVADGTAKQKFPEWQTIAAHDGEVFTAPVGQYHANGFGLHDMHGNVWEWCRDGFNEKLTGGIDPVGVSSGRSWVMRGGCWHNSGFECLPANRGFSRTDSRGSGLGFRVALVSIQDQS
jgi:formylglycine-generating enzyme required for sulfatase activity